MSGRSSAGEESPRSINKNCDDEILLNDLDMGVEQDEYNIMGRDDNSCRECA